MHSRVHYFTRMHRAIVSRELLLTVTLLCLTNLSLTSPAYANIGAHTTEVLSVRLGQTPGRTRLVFDLSDSPAPFTLTALRNPSRLIIELPQSSSSFDPASVPLKGTPIERIEAGPRNMDGDAALLYVFNLSHDIEPDLFALKPYLDHGHRLVLDLYLPSEPEEKQEIAAKEPPIRTQQAPIQLAARDPSRKQIPPRQSDIKAKAKAKAEKSVSEEIVGEWSGYASLDARVFFSDPAYPEQDDHNVSLAFEPAYYVDWAQGNQRLAFRPFFRYDANDDERSHVDIRELYWRLEHQQFVFKAGVDVIFWGVTESQHLVDVINQTDLVENIDGEDKLGQPMLNVDYLSENWGLVQAYVLPYFRERTFAGKEGRLRPHPYVDMNDARYESDDEEKNIDFAVRWSHYIGDWDFGLAHFSGTSRTPYLISSGTVARPRLSPLYMQIDQTSLDVQATLGAWLWKLEAIHNANRIEDYFAAVGGFEYTWFGVGDSAADLGWLLEYHYDERDERANSALQKDVFLGLRYTGNDIAGTRLLAGVIVDTDSDSTFTNLEAVRRLGESWTITLEARLFSNIDNEDPMRPLEEDDYIELQLSRFF